MMPKNVINDINSNISLLFKAKHICSDPLSANTLTVNTCESLSTI